MMDPGDDIIDVLYRYRDYNYYRPEERGSDRRHLYHDGTCIARFDQGQEIAEDLVPRAKSVKADVIDTQA